MNIKDKLSWEKEINRKDFIRLSAGAVCTVALGGLLSVTGKAAAQGGDYKRIVVLSDIHIPSDTDNKKIQVLNEINTWDDVHHVTIVGDICKDTGDANELNAAVNLLSNLKKPTYALTGNHDYLYSDQSSDGDKGQAGPEERAFKLERFRKAFKMKALYFSEDLDNYHLVYLSPDSLDSIHLTEMSIEQLIWLEEDLERNRNKPTIIFFHGSLEGTWGGNNWPGSSKFMAQPINEVRSILANNPQVFLWVSGHLHLGAYNNSCNNAKVYTYSEHGIKNIHNPALVGSGYLSDKDNSGKNYPTMWTKSLYLYPDRVEIRTYDHGTHTMLKELDTVVKL